MQKAQIPSWCRWIIVGGLCIGGGFVGVLAPARAADVVLNIPTTHPRLWFGNAARLAQARNYSQSHPIDIPGYPNSAAARNRALRSVITGAGANPTTDANCTQAVDWLRSYDLEAALEDNVDNIPDGGPCDMHAASVSCDRARWGGEDALLIYDWCHATIDALPAAQKTALITKWNGYIGVMNAHPSNWQNQQANNYFAGYMRNTILWGIASFGENPRAQEFINHGLQTRLVDRYAPWAANFGKGGVPGEGTQYGAYQLGYSVIALQSAADFGFDAYSRTPYYNEATYYLMYHTTPGPTLEPDASNPRYELFPFSDIGEGRHGGMVQNSDYANLMAVNALRAPSVRRANHALAWLQRTGVASDWWVRAALSGLAVNADASDLPLDYYASGYRFLYSRSSRATDATAVLLQLGGVGTEERGGAVHDSTDAGQLQFWRKGRWVSRASYGYRGTPGTDEITGFNNEGKVFSDAGVARNVVLFGGQKNGKYQMRAQIGQFAAPSTVLRLQTAPDFTYAAVDLKSSYRAPPTTQCWNAADDWPFADVVIREAIVLRPWNATLIFDRLRSSSDSQLLPVYTQPCGSSGYSGPVMLANQVTKSFVLHFANAPTVVGHRVTGANTPAQANPQALDAHILLPPNATPRVINEKSCCSQSEIAQYRIEVDQTGAAEGYNLVVVHARDLGEAPLTAQLVQNGNNWTVSLVRANGSTAVVQLVGGMISTGGSVQFDNGAVQPLLPRVQGISIGDDGPVWENLMDRIFANGFQ